MLFDEELNLIDGDLSAARASIDQAHADFRRNVVWSSMYTAMLLLPLLLMIKQVVIRLRFSNQMRECINLIGEAKESESILDDGVPIHCFVFGLQTFLHLLERFPSIQFCWYSRY